MTVASVITRVMPVAQAAIAKRPWPAGTSRVILGSSSYSRQAIMKEMAQEYGFAYETATADIDEQALGNRQHSPAALVELLAQAKADAIIGKLCQSESAPLQGYLLTCDQVVVYQNVIREKPVTKSQAKEFLASYSSSPAGTVGAVQCTDLASRQAFRAVDSTWTHFQEIPPEVVDQVVAEGTVMKCAGGLMVENPALMPYITKTEGTQDAVMGLPKALVLQVVSQAVQASTGQEAAESLN